MACESQDGKLLIPVSEIDYTYLDKDLFPEAQKRLLWQLRNSDTICNYLGAIFTEMQLLFNAVIDVLDERQLAKAAGEQLNVIGRIVGQDRVVIDASTQFFAWDDTPNALGWGEREEDIIIGGGRWKEIGEPTSGTRVLLDVEFRQFIVAKIFRNHMKFASPCELSSIANIILPSVTRTQVVTLAPALAQYHFDAPGGLTADEIAIIGDVTDDKKADRQRIITVGAGIGIEKYTQQTEDIVFGWSDNPDPSVGGWSEKSVSETVFGFDDSPTPKGWWGEDSPIGGSGVYADRPNDEGNFTVLLDTTAAGTWAEQIIT
jgi:hypothetical protein